MVTTTVALPANLHKRLAIAGVEERAALTELVRDALTEWLDRRERRRRAR